MERFLLDLREINWEAFAETFPSLALWYREKESTLHMSEHCAVLQDELHEGFKGRTWSWHDPRACWERICRDCFRTHTINGHQQAWDHFLDDTVMLEGLETNLQERPENPELHYHRAWLECHTGQTSSLALHESLHPWQERLLARSHEIIQERREDLQGKRYLLCVNSYVLNTLRETLSTPIRAHTLLVKDTHVYAVIDEKTKNSLPGLGTGKSIAQVRRHARLGSTRPFDAAPLPGRDLLEILLVIHNPENLETSLKDSLAAAHVLLETR